MTQQEGWRALAREWHVSLDGVQPCEAVAASRLQCYSNNGNLALLRQLGRPALLALRSSEGQTAWAVLSGSACSTSPVNGASTSTVSPEVAVRSPIRACASVPSIICPDMVGVYVRVGFDTRLRR